MRNVAFLLLLLCLLGAVSCRQCAAYPPALLRADSLTYADPEAALSLLRSLDAEMAVAPEPVRMYHGLLTVKATDKAYLPHTSDSLMRSLLHHYENGGDPALLPEVYYYAGGTYRDLNDAPRALGYYQKALDAMADGHDNLRVRSVVHAQMGGILYRQRLYEEARKAHIEAYQCNLLLRDTVGLIHELIDIGNLWHSQNNLDSAFIYMNRALQLAREKQDEYMAGITYSQLATIHIESGEYKKAKEEINYSLKHVNRSNVSHIYSTLSKVYYHLGQKDSAAYYYDELLKYGNVYGKRAAYEGKYMLLMDHEQNEEAKALMQNYKEYTDSILRYTATESVEQMNSLYSYEQWEKENLRLRHAREQERALYRTVGITLASVILLLGGVILYYRQRKRLLTLEVSSMKHYQEEQYRRTSQYIEDNKCEIRTLTDSIDSLQAEIGSLHNEKQTLQDRNSALLREKEALLAKLEQQREKICHENELARIAVQEKDEAARRIATSEVYASLGSLIASEGHLTGDLLKQVESLLDEVCPDFRPWLLSHQLSAFNYAVCLLAKLGIPSTHIAQLNSRERSTVTHAKKNIYRQLTGLHGKPSDFDSFIQSL